MKMADFLMEFSLFPLVLTFLCYQIGLWCQKKLKSPLLNPILIATVLVIGVLLLTGVPNEHYQAGTSHITWLITPATVCLALPLYEHLKVLKKSLPAILSGIAAGTVSSLGFIFLLCKLFSLENAVMVSLLPKSITTAMGMVLAEQNGGIGALAAAAIIITGILGSLLGSVLCKLFRFKDPVAQGVAFGTASHVVGTSRAAELGGLQGAVSSLSLAIAGILTAVLFPLVMQLV
jgi:predicted murein hydrolase (TIGR00659 family)